MAQRVERVADQLRLRGAGPGDLVGVCLPRAQWLAPALFGVLSCGAAYVPLDPAYPVDRLRLIAVDAGLKVVVCDERTVDLVAAVGAEPVVLGADSAEQPGPDIPPGTAAVTAGTEAAAPEKLSGLRLRAATRGPRTTRRTCSTPRAPPAYPRVCRSAIATR